MTPLQIDLFWFEIEQIQERYAQFFPLSQLKYISINDNGNNHEVEFREGYNLPDEITLEIVMAFKLAKGRD